MNNLSITARMLIVALAPAVLVACLLSVWSFIEGVNDVERSETRRARTLVESLAKASEFAVASGNDTLIEGLTQQTLSMPSITEVQFSDAQGNSLGGASLGTASETIDEGLNRHFWYRLLNPPQRIKLLEPILITDLADFDDPLFVADEATPAGASPNAASSDPRIGTLHLTVDLSSAYHQRFDSVGQGFMGTLLVLIAATPAAVWLARSVSRPVRDVTHAMQRLERHEYVVTEPTQAGGEVGELGRGVTRLSQELQSFHTRLQESARIATDDLHLALDALEQRNNELDDARAAAEKASAFKSEFLANMSHEIRTPMNTVIGTLSTLNRTPLDVDQAEQVALINVASENLLALIDDILDITKIETGNLHVASVSCSISKILSDVCDGTTVHAFERGIELCVATPPRDLPTFVLSDPLRLKQVLLNLVANAIKFSEQGHVLVETELAGGTLERPWIRFAVTDTGIGIAESQQARLFDAFAQADMSTTRNHGGVGLGLHICRGIVELLGGRIELDSTLGIGSRFTVTLPFDTDPTAPAATHRRALPQRIRYIDDYAPLADIHRRALRAAGAQLSDEPSAPRDDADAVTVMSIRNAILLAVDRRDAVEAPLPPHDGKLVAIVGRSTPDIKAWLEHNGFDGHLVRTPDPDSLARRLASAIDELDADTPSTSEVVQRLHHSAERRQTRHAVPADELPSATGSKPVVAPRASAVSAPLRAVLPSAFDDMTALPSRAIDVLAVDDQRMNLDLLARYFAHLNVRGYFARTDADVKRHIESRAFDLILLDLHMPERDGFDIVTELRHTDGPNRWTPTIALTADAYADSRERAFACGFDAVLTKPVTIEQMRDEFDRWIANPDTLVSIDACAAGMLDDRDWALGAIRTYQEEIPEHITSLDSALTQGNLPAVQEVAHALKGVSDICRVNDVSAAARALEHASENGDMSRTALLGHRLIALLQIVDAACSEELAQGADEPSLSSTATRSDSLSPG